MPDRSPYEESIERECGKIYDYVLKDSDHDLIPDYADGFDILGPSCDDDNFSSHYSIPIVIEISPCVDLLRRKITISYLMAPDPAGFFSGHEYPFEFNITNSILGLQHYRLWRKPTWESRTVDDLVRPGSYSAYELFGRSGVHVLYLEAIPITSVHSYGIGGHYDGFTLGHSEVVLLPNATRPRTIYGEEHVNIKSRTVYLVERNISANSIFFVSHLVPAQYETHLDPVTELPSNVLVGSERRFAIVYDSYDYDFQCAPIDTVYVNDVPFSIDINWDTNDPVAFGWLRTPYFNLVNSTTTPLPSSEYAIVAVDNSLSIRYNPTWPWSSSPGFKELPKYVTELQNAVETIVVEMKESNWTPPPRPPGSPADSGAFGKEVHARVTQELQGKPGWVCDVWVERSNNIVRGIGTTQPSGYASLDLQQVDVIRVADGYEVNVGDVLDREKIQDIFDIKTSVNGRVTQNQLIGLEGVRGGSVLVSTPPYRLNASNQWEVHPLGSLKREPISQLGGMKSNLKTGSVATVAAITGAGVVWSMFHFSDLEPEFDRLEQLAAVLKREDPGTVDQVLSAIEYCQAVNAILGKFMIDDTASNFIDLAIIYGMLGGMNY